MLCLCSLLIIAFISLQATVANWSKVFYIAAAVYTFTATFYAIFASAELQPWGEGLEEEAGDIPMKKKRFEDSNEP